MSHSNNRVDHPYFPRDAEIKYKPNDMDVTEILTYFFGAVLVVLPLLSIVSLWGYQGSFKRKAILCWFLLSGSIHMILEGHFSVYHSDIASRMDFLSQVWKEYAKGDSRYMIKDAFTVCMETITAFIDGPLCFLTVWSFVTNRPSRYLLQLIVSLAQLYGDVLYMSTELYDDCPHGPKYHPLYFWFYFVVMNSFWIVIPLLLIMDSWRQLQTAQSVVDLKPFNKHD